MTPKVSVIMPVYNGERFLGDAVESILNQTFTDFELIAIDDGSKDRSLEILHSFAARDPRVRVCGTRANSGAGAARNTGIELAAGEFVAIMDADDVSLPDRFERQVSFLVANPDVGIVGSNVQIIDDGGRLGRIHQYPAQPSVVAWSMLFFNPVPHSTVMVRRELLRQSGAYSDEGFDATEDYALLSRLSQTSRVANLTTVLLLYRSWDGNMTHTKWALQERSAANIAIRLADSLGISLSVDDATVLRDLSRGPYPRDTAQLRTAALVVSQWTEALLSNARWEAGDRKLMRRAAAIKLLQIGSLALGRSPLLAVSAASSALRLSPAAPFYIARKARFRQSAS